MLPSLERFSSRAVGTAPRVGSRNTDDCLEQLVRSGRHVLDLKPYPDRQLPEHVLAAAADAARRQITAPSRGILTFRVAVANALNAELGLALDPGMNVLATSGGMHSLFLIFLAVLNPGDEVLAPAPCYFLDGLVKPLGGELVYVQMDRERGYAWDLDRLESAITSHTKCIFVNSPVNPTGHVLTGDEMARLSEIAERYDLLLISDESYDRMLYDGRHHTSVATQPGAFGRTLIVRSLTKSFAMPGWRVGYIAGPHILIDLLTKALEWNMLYGSHVSQAAAAAALSGPQEWLLGVADEFQAARDAILPRIRAIPELSVVTPKGGPFLLLNMSDVPCDEERFIGLLLTQFQIPATAGRYFCAPGHLRIAFGATKAVLEETAARLALAVALAQERKASHEVSC